MIYFQSENVYESEADFYGTPCLYCGYDLCENHVCNTTPTQFEKEFAEEILTQRKRPTLWDCFTI